MWQAPCRRNRLLGVCSRFMMELGKFCLQSTILKFKGWVRSANLKRKDGRDGVSYVRDPDILVEKKHFGDEGQPQWEAERRPRDRVRSRVLGAGGQRLPYSSTFLFTVTVTLTITISSWRGGAPSPLCRERGLSGRNSSLLASRSVG